MNLFMKIKREIINKRKCQSFHKISKHVFWKIDRKNRLVFLGKGSIPGYAPAADYLRERPWKNVKFQGVVIGKGITDIHPTALLGVDLDQVILVGGGRRGDGLEMTEAGLYSHLKRELLIGRDQEKVEIAEGTVDINPFAFAFHQKVKEIGCPSSLQRIGVSAFEGCRKLRHIYRIPVECKIGRAAFKDTNGLKIYFDKNPAKAKLHEMHPKNAITEHGRGFLMNGEFVFFTHENKRNIDPTKFYRCRDLIDIKGGENFIIGLRANGEVLYETVHAVSDIFDCYYVPFRFEEKGIFERLNGWKNISEIAVSGKAAAGLSKDGMVFCTNSEDENQPIPNFCGIISLEVKGKNIYAVKEDWTVVRIAGEDTSDEECVLCF